MKNIRIYAFLPPFVLLTIAAAYSLVIGMRNETKAIAFLSHLFDMALDTFGWFYALAALLVCLLTIFLMFSRYGDIKFGGPDAQPEYSYWNWFAMTLCAGIAIGVVFWGAAEPVMQFMNPPKSLGIVPFSEEAARFSLAQIFLEWTLTPYAMYTVCGISCAYAFYNRIVETLNKKILLVEIECCDSINAFQVFDSLNGKGLDLTAADRIKNKVFSWAKSESARDKKREAWDRIVEKVGDQHVTDFLVSLVFARSAKRCTKNGLPKEFGRLFEGEAKGDYFKFLRDLEEYADLYSSLRTPEKFRPALRDTLEGLSELKIEQVYTILLSAAMYYKDDYLGTSKDMAAFFREAEALVVRLQICDKSPNKLDPIFSALIRKMAGHAPVGDLVKDIEAEKRSIASDGEFLECFAHYATGNDAVGRFYMRRLDDLLRKERGDGHKTATSDKLTLEHIVPQAVELADWYAPASVPDEVRDDPKETLINRLGNMALLSLEHNAAVGNASYPEKRSFYMARQKDGYCPMEWFDLIRTLVDKYPDKFRKEEVDERQRFMATLALRVW